MSRFALRRVVVSSREPPPLEFAPREMAAVVLCAMIAVVGVAAGMIVVVRVAAGLERVREACRAVVVVVCCALAQL